MLEAVTRKTPFSGFEWDAGNCGKCQKHGVSIQEIEHVLTHAETLITPDPKNPVGEPQSGHRPHAAGTLYVRGLHASRSRVRRPVAADQRSPHAQEGDQEI